MRINLTVSLLALACSFAAAQINTNTNFNIISPQPIDTRDTLTTLADTANVPSVQLFPGLLSYVVSLKQYWTYNGAYWEPLSKGFDLFVYAIANNADYSLPLDTLKKYNRVVLFTGSVTTSTRVTLPNLSGTTGLSGKKIEIRYSTGPSGIFSVGSASNIFRYNCSGYDIDEGPLTGDTLAFSLKDKIEYLIYGTSYLRHCPAIDVPDASPADTSTFLVYAPAHSLEDSITAYGYVPVKIDYTKANASAFDSTHFAYAVSAPHADTLELKLSGALAVTGHGLTVGRLYYLQDDGTESTTSGTIRAPTVYVLDANTVVLTEVGADQDQVISRQAVPSPVFTFWGGDPQNPSDSIMQIVVDSVFAPAGLAKPSTIFFMSYSSQSKNPTYQDDSPTDSPLNPSHSWFYDGNVVTRMNHLLTSVDLQATSAGLFTLDTVMLVDGIPTDSTVANWLDTNYVQNNLRLPNGAILYWKGDGTAQSPRYKWMIIDDIANTGETNDFKRILKNLSSDPVDTTVIATRHYADSLFAVADSLRELGDKSAPILIPVFDRITQLNNCATSLTVNTGFILIDDTAINEGDVVFEINASPATITYDLYNEDSTAYYFEEATPRTANTYFWEVSYEDADGNTVGDSNSFEVIAGRPDTISVLLQDSILVTRVCGAEVSRDTIPLADVLPADNVTGTGTTNRTALWTAANTIGNSYLLQSASSLTLDANKMFVNIGGTTASRPGATAGGHWFNTSDLRPQWSDGVSWYYYSPWQRLSSDEISWTDGTPEMSISNNGIEFYPDGTVDITESYGVGYQLGVSASSTFFSGGAGYQLGYGNSGTRFSGGVGYRLGYLNTGAYFSGGAGVGLGQQNTGNNFSGGAGYLLGYQNTGNNFSGGAGYALGNANTGANFSGGAGYQLGQSNSGISFSGGSGYQLGFQNTGAYFSGGAGYRLGYQNTGANFSGGAGLLLGYLNSGDFVSGGAGAYCLYWNGGDYATANGAYAAYLNEGSYITTVGAESLYGNSKDSLTAIGYRAGYFQEDVTKLDTFIQSNMLTNDTIKINGSTAKWGAVGDIVPLFTTRLGVANYTPIGLQKYQITSDSTIKCLLPASATSNSELVKIAIGLQYSNATLVGAFAQPDKDNQIVLGNSAVEEIKLGPGRLRSDNFSIAKQGWIYEYSEAEQALVLAPNPVQVRQNATYYEETERQYTLGTSPSADTVITIDTIGVAFAADSISISAGLIENLRAGTVTWLVRYDFTFDSDEDACYAFFDLTTDGSEVPAPLPGSSAYGNAISTTGTQFPGRSFLVDVPSGQSVRLCVKGNVIAATEMNISYLTITIQER